MIPLENSNSNQSSPSDGAGGRHRKRAVLRRPCDGILVVLFSVVAGGGRQAVRPAPHNPPLSSSPRSSSSELTQVDSTNPQQPIAEQEERGATCGASCTSPSCPRASAAPGAFRPLVRSGRRDKRARPVEFPRRGTVLGDAQCGRTAQTQRRTSDRLITGKRTRGKPAEASDFLRAPFRLRIGKRAPRAPCIGTRAFTRKMQKDRREEGPRCASDASFTSECLGFWNFKFHSGTRALKCPFQAGFVFLTAKFRLHLACTCARTSPAR